MALPININSRRGVVTNGTIQRMQQRLLIILSSLCFMMVLLLLCSLSSILIYHVQMDTSLDLLNALDDNEHPAPKGALNKDGQPGYHDNGIVLKGTKKVLENASLHDNGIVLNGTKKVLENASLRSPSGGTKAIDESIQLLSV